MSDVHLSSHGAYHTEYHISWVTKYRRPILDDGIQRYLKKLLPKITKTMPGCEIIEVNILDDHVHMVMVIPPKYAVKDVVGRLKGKSSSKLKRKLSINRTIWSPGYFVRTVGVPEEKIIDYVHNQ